MRHDLVLGAFGAAVPALAAAATDAERAGYDGVWAFDHFSGAMLGRPWSRDPFVVLAAIAAVTERVTLGPLVANIANRHPAQLASALNSLQSLAPARVVCGVGSGAAPGSRFAGESELIDRSIADDDTRRARLVETVACLRAIWDGRAFAGAHYRVGAAAGIVDGAPQPPIVVGASAAPTVRVAATLADEINIRDGARLPELVDTARRAAGGRPVRVSVFMFAEPGHPTGGDTMRLDRLGVDARTLYVTAGADGRFDIPSVPD